MNLSLDVIIRNLILANSQRKENRRLLLKYVKEHSIHILDQNKKEKVESGRGSELSDSQLLELVNSIKDKI